MRALILVAGASLAVSACGDPVPDSNETNLIEINEGPDDGNWVAVNTDEAKACPEDHKCAVAPDETD